MRGHVTAKAIGLGKSVVLSGSALNGVDLGEPAGLKKLEAALAGKIYLGG